MSDAVIGLLPTLLKLPAEDRKILASELISSLRNTHDENSPEFLEMLNRRMEEMMKDPSKCIAADKVFAKVREKFS